MVTLAPCRGVPSAAEIVPPMVLKKSLTAFNPLDKPAVPASLFFSRTICLPITSNEILKGLNSLLSTSLNLSSLAMTETFLFCGRILLLYVNLTPADAEIVFLRPLSFLRQAGSLTLFCPKLPGHSHLLQMCSSPD